MCKDVGVQTDSASFQMPNHHLDENNVNNIYTCTEDELSRLQQEKQVSHCIAKNVLHVHVMYTNHTNSDSIEDVMIIILSLHPDYGGMKMVLAPSIVYVGCPLQEPTVHGVKHPVPGLSTVPTLTVTFFSNAFSDII